MPNRFGSIAALAWSAPLFAVIALAPGSTASAAVKSFSSNNLCAGPIQRVEWKRAIPARLLGAISIAESGRFDPGSRARIAWPWTVNAGGDARYYATKAQAIAGVRRLKARGVRNIDVGCMQVNLLHHPKAFTDLEAAFDPATNVAYAARFLKELYGRTGSWVSATAAYHSSEMRRGHPYMLRVMKIWMKPPGGSRPTQLASSRGQRRAGSASIGKPARPASGPPQGNQVSASLVRRANAQRTAKARRKWADVMVRRKRFAAWLTDRRAKRRAERNPS